MLRVFILAVGLQASILWAQAPADNVWEAPLFTEAESLGKAAWRPMLKHLAEMHLRSTHPATAPFEFPWEDTGTGYALGPGFGHWDLVHEVLDTLPATPGHARQELLNDVRLQLQSGFLPGLYWMSPGCDRRSQSPV